MSIIAAISNYSEAPTFFHHKSNLRSVYSALLEKPRATKKLEETYRFAVKYADNYSFVSAAVVNEKKEMAMTKRLRERSNGLDGDGKQVHYSY